MLRIAFLDLRLHWRIVSIMILFFAINVFAYLLTTGYRISINKQFFFIDQNYLIVHEADTSAEYYGSRVNMVIGEKLKERNISQIIPAVHSFTTLAGREVQFVYGVDLEQYQQVEHFELLSGRALQAGDSDRDTMIGYLLAEKIKANVGDSITLRGRDFRIIGIFRKGTFTDNDAWISLQSAQALLGWGEDVSYYIIPDEGLVNVGELVDKGITISRRGESVYASARQYLQIMDLFSFIIQLMGIGTIITMGSLIMRITYLHRYQLALLRTCGFSQISLYLYILTQGGIIFFSGFSIGLFVSLLFPLAYQLNVNGWQINPSFQMLDIFISFCYLMGIVLIGILIPVVWLNRLNLSNLLRSE